MKKTYLIIVIIFLFLSATDRLNAQANTRDSLVLVNFYDSTDGAVWDSGGNWLTIAPLNTWDYVSIYHNGLAYLGTSDRVTELNFAYRGLLDGVIPYSLGDLDSLQLLYFDQNNLNGNIPANLGNLSILQSLELEKNNLSGSIPASLGNLTKLINLWLQNNNLSDSIPASLGNLSKLTELFLQYNQLSGSIPATLGNMTSLQQLTLQYNQLSGPVPSSLGNLANLTTLSLQNNKFTFSGMEGIAKKFSFATYAPQASVPLQQNGNTFSVSVGGTPANNTYKWYKNDTLVATKVADSTYTFTSNGKYWVAATNAVATKLTLYSDTITITALPIKDINLQAKATNGQVLLQWQTVGEVNTATFIIQRSADGSLFTDIGAKEAVGSGNNGYSFIDLTPAPQKGVLYYRLQSVDKDGVISYSKVASVSTTNYELGITIKPNPVKDVLTIGGSHIATVQVIDNLGRVAKVVSTKDATNPTLYVGSLPAGVYHLRVVTTDGKVSGLGMVKE